MPSSGVLKKVGCLKTDVFCHIISKGQFDTVLENNFDLCKVKVEFNCYLAIYSALKISKCVCNV